MLLGLRHDGLPVAAYFLGRALDLTRDELRAVVPHDPRAPARAVAAFGLVDVYAIPLQWWRDSGAPGWFREQLGFAYRGLSGLPENFVYNTGDERPLRRLVSTFLSPLATSYLLVVALLVAAAWLARRPAARPDARCSWLALVALLFAGLLWTHSRSSYLALALGLVVLRVRAARGAAAQRLALVGAAFAVIAVGAAFVARLPGHRADDDVHAERAEVQRANAAKGTGAAASGVDGREHREPLAQPPRRRARRSLHHPQGFGLGNAGSTASRTDVEIKAGESTYTELGVETGLARRARLRRVVARRSRWRVLPRSRVVAASLVAVLALGLQTDVIGVPWLAYVVWALAGARA